MLVTKLVHIQIVDQLWLGMVLAWHGVADPLILTLGDLVNAVSMEPNDHASSLLLNMFIRKLLLVKACQLQRESRLTTVIR